MIHPEPPFQITHLLFILE